MSLRASGCSVCAQGEVTLLQAASPQLPRGTWAVHIAENSSGKRAFLHPIPPPSHNYSH